MTEQEWLQCADPTPMLEFLRGKASERKLRLVAVAFIRLSGGATDDDGFSHWVVEAAERYADGLITDHERAGVHAPAYESYEAGRWDDDRERTAVAHAANCAIHHDAVFAARHVSSGWQGVGGGEARRASAAHCYVFREIIGNPFRPVVVNPSWLTPTVANLAAAAYGERALPSGELDPSRLAVLSDALEEVGCTDADILNHPRSPGPHVRGCWAVDLLTGRS